MTLGAPPAPEVDRSKDLTDAEPVASGSLVISTWTTVSRVTGLAKLAVIAAVLGPTYMGNAFHGMNLFPTAAYEFLTGSLLVNLLVPHLTRHLSAGRRDDVARVAGGFLGRAMIGFGALAAVLFVARPAILAIFTSGVSDPSVAAAQRSAGSTLLALMLPQILLYAIAGVAGSVLNAAGRFGLVAAAPAFENLGIIATVATAGAMFGDGVRTTAAPTAALLVLGGGATAAVAAHAAALWFACRRDGITLLPRLARGDPEVRAIVSATPATVGQAGMNALRTLVALVVANSVAGGVVAFQFAMTFFYLPAAVGAKAVGVPMLRRLSTAFDRSDEEGFRKGYAEGLRLTAFIVIPAALAYLALATPIVRAVSFGEIATSYGIGLVAVALTVLAPGVVGEAFFLLGSYAGYARHDASTPLRSMTVRTVITVGGMVAAAFWTQGRTLIIALGLAVTAGNLVASGHLAWAQRRWLALRGDVARSILRTSVASFAMLAVAMPIAVALATLMPGTPVVVGAFTGAAGIAAYVFVSRRLGSDELSALLRRTPDESRPDILQNDRGQTVAVSDGAVTKSYGGADAAARARREFDRLERVWAHVVDRTDITAPQPLSIDAVQPAVRMTEISGERVDDLLAAESLKDDELATLCARMVSALDAYTSATEEPYHDFHFRNALYDREARRLGIIDFDTPAHLGELASTAAPIARSVGNLVGSTVFETVRPRRFFATRFRRQALDLCRRIADASDCDPAIVRDLAEEVYARAAFHGSPMRRVWYRTVGALIKPATPVSTPIVPVAASAGHEAAPAVVQPRPLPEVTLRAALIMGAIAVIAAGALASSAPFYTAVVASGVMLGIAFAVHPPLVAYALLAATPLVVGLNRSWVIPTLRVNEAIVLIGGAALIARGVVLWAIQGRPTKLRIGRMERALAVLVVTGSVAPIAWLAARGRPITRDDFLYALVLWKLAAIFFVVRAAVRTEREVRRCLYVSLGSVAIVAMIGIAQAIELGPIPAFLARFFAPEGLTAIVTNNRATSTIGNAIAFADVMAIHAAIAAAFILRHHRRRLVLASLAGVFAVGALASGQLSGALALFVAAVATSLVTRRRVAVALAAVPIVLLALFVLRPVVEQRLSKVDPMTGVPQSWTARQENLETYFLPELERPSQLALGVRPAARVPAHEGWRDWVYIESGYVWILWTGGLPFLLAFFWYIRHAYRSTAIQARYRSDAVGVAAVASISALAIVTFLMVLDPHLTMRGTADATFALLGLATAPITWWARVAPHAEAAS